MIAILMSQQQQLAMKPGIRIPKKLSMRRVRSLYHYYFMLELKLTISFQLRISSNSISYLKNHLNSTNKLVKI